MAHDRSGWGCVLMAGHDNAGHRTTTCPVIPSIHPLQRDTVTGVNTASELRRNAGEIETGTHHAGKYSSGADVAPA